MRTSAGEIEDRAAEWIVLAQEHHCTADRARLEAWLEEDPRHRAAYLRLQAVWGKTARLKALRDPDGGIDEDLLRAEADKRPAAGKWVALAAAAAMVAVGTVAWWNFSQPRWQTHATERDGFARVALRDGSTVDLNGSSEIRARLTSERREVVLTRGEGHFVVARESQRPFVVLAGGKQVRAVGTAFSVRLGEREKVEVLVTEGRVAIENRNTVDAGEVAAIEKDNVVVQQIEPAQVAGRLAWAAGRLYFAGETLGEAVTQFNRYTTRKLVIADPELAHLRIGRNFRATDAEGFVSALADSFGVRADLTEAREIRLEGR